MTDLNERIHELKGRQHECTADGICMKCVALGTMIPDYPSDPAATLEALIELIANGITITECQCEDGCYGVDIYFQGSCRHAPREQIPEAMWTTWCEWKEKGDEI